jgi:heat shock protein HslJ
MLKAISLFATGFLATVGLASADTARDRPVVTRWRVVELAAADGTKVTADAPEKFTVEFRDDGTVSMRIDCNRGQGTWTSSGPGQLVFGPLAMTKVACQPNPMTELWTRDLAAVRSYEERGGHLFLALEDGGVYDLAPEPPPAPVRVIPSTLVQFPPSRNRVTLHDMLRGPDRAVWDYVVAVGAGQTLWVSVRASNRAATSFEILAPGNETPLYRADAEKQREWKDKVSTAGDYRVRVSLDDQAAKRGDSSNFTLRVGVY